MPPLFVGRKDKKKEPNLPPEDESNRFKGGFLTFGSSFFQPSHLLFRRQWFLWKSSPITVAGAVSDFHELPCSSNRILKLSKKNQSITLPFQQSRQIKEKAARSNE
jgi:hypothetical protein